MKLSIIICTYNVEGRLEKTLDSILVQNVNDYEVIIIDGNSNDKTLDIIKKYEKNFNGKLKWMSEEDSGIYNAMNKGIKMAEGEYLNIVGAGDWLEKNALKEAYKCIKDNPSVDAVYGKLRMWEKNSEKSYIVQTHPDSLIQNPMQHPSLYYKKSLHNKFGMYDESYKIAADYLFCLRAFYFGKAKIETIDTVTNNFVMDGISSVQGRECRKENKKIRKELNIKNHIRISHLVKFIKKRLKFNKINRI